VITAILGAPGSAKSTLASLLVPLLPAHVVLDWDLFMGPAAALAGRDIRHHPETWPAYRQLVHAVVGVVAHMPVVLFTVCTPGDLPTGRAPEHAARSIARLVQGDGQQR
jgi:hypothetical protein